MIFSRHFNSDWEYKHQIHALEFALEESQFQVSLLQHQMRDLEQTVVQILPRQDLGKNKIYSDLVKTLRAPASVPNLDLSGVTMERGKGLFSQGKFDSAIREFEKIKQNFPASAYQVQAEFFLAESLFLKREFKKSIDVIDEMVLQFPDHELTGFILLRLGQISEHNSQVEEAQEIYRTVLNNFPQAPLREQARTLLKSTEFEP